MDDHRLVTITGSGGCGKTRIAIQLAGRLASDFADGVRFIDLSVVVDASGVDDAVAFQHSRPIALVALAAQGDIATAGTTLRTYSRAAHATGLPYASESVCILGGVLAGLQDEWARAARLLAAGAMGVYRDPANSILYLTYRDEAPPGARLGTGPRDAGPRDGRCPWTRPSSSRWRRRNWLDQPRIERQNRSMAASFWPLFDLTIRTPRLTMRPPNDADVFALALLASRGIHDPKDMPFRHPWTDVPSPQFERNTLQFHWRVRASWSVEEWHLPFAVWVDGEIVGQQDIVGRDFLHTRTFETGSWLGQAHQGQGIGKEMRLAILHLGFLGLGAERAETGAYEYNAASLGVTQALGYVDNGDAVFAPRGDPQVERKFKMDRRQFEAIRRDDIAIENLEPCLPMFGLASD